MTGTQLVIAVISLVILYFIIKAAVRNGIIEAHDRMHDDDLEEDSGIEKVACPSCGRMVEMDSPKCPHCGNCMGS